MNKRKLEMKESTTYSIACPSRCTSSMPDFAPFSGSPQRDILEDPEGAAHLGERTNVALPKHRIRQQPMSVTV